jgi:hypothetical protein
MSSLPANVRPFACAHRFPRITNSIADLWRRTRECEEYLDSLVIDCAADRTGFPPDVRKSFALCAATTPIFIRSAITRGSSSTATISRC